MASPVRERAIVRRDGRGGEDYPCNATPGKMHHAARCSSYGLAFDSKAARHEMSVALQRGNAGVAAGPRARARARVHAKTRTYSSVSLAVSTRCAERPDGRMAVDRMAA